MEVNLLRELLDDALNEPNEFNRIGCFWCHEESHVTTLIDLKKMLFNKNLHAVCSEEGIITRVEDGFYAEDVYGGKVLFTFEETEFLIDLWEKVKLQVPNIIRYEPEVNEIEDDTLKP